MTKEPKSNCCQAGIEFNDNNESTGPIHRCAKCKKLRGFIYPLAGKITESPRDKMIRSKNENIK